MKNRRTLAVLLVLVMALAVLLSGCGSSDDSIKLNTGGKGGTYYKYGKQIAKLSNEKLKDTKLEAASTNGSASNLRLLSQGLGPMAIVQNDTLSNAYNGVGDFSEAAVTSVRAVAGLYTESIQVVATKSSGIETISDLKGKRISVGAKDSGVLGNAKEILQAYGIDFADITPVYKSFDASAKAMEEGKIDAFFCTAGAPTDAVSQLAKKVDISLVSLDDRAISQIMNLYDGYSVSVIPKGTYPGMKHSVKTIGVKAVLVADESVDEGTIQTVLKVLVKNQDALRLTAGAIDPMSLNFATDDISVPFHDGAVDWYQTQGVEVKGAQKQERNEQGTPILHLDMYQTIALAVVALILGAWLRRKVKFFETFCIPAPVIGGLIFSIVTCVLYVAGVIEISFDDTLKTVCMVIFFTSVGFQANMKVLKSGGKALLVFLLAVIVLITLQNTLAVGLSKGLNVSALVGMCTGSIPMVGGHGTAGAFGPLLEDMNLKGASTLATAAATFGLIMGSLMGGPLGNSLITKKNLIATAIPVEDEEIGAKEDEKGGVKEVVSKYAPATNQLLIAMGIGTVVSLLLSKTGMTFPIYIGSMIVAAIMRNYAEYTGKIEINMPEIDDIGNICLSLFLGIAMITLQLWQLAALALPLIVLLLGQTILMFIYARFVVFNVMGRDYDAAVLAAGTCGFGMGATPNAMANMQAITQKFVPSVKAFLLVPIVGSMFADFFNSLIITFFINMVA